MRANTAKDRIMTHLNDYYGESFSNRELADTLALPAASVRRTVNELKAAGSVITDIYAEGRNPRYLAA